MPTNEELDGLRRRLDDVDSQIIASVARRMALCRAVGELKEANGIAIMQHGRVAAVRAHYFEEGGASGLRGEFAMELADLLVREACHLESVPSPRPPCHEGDRTQGRATRVTFLTLGPAGSCHEAAVQRYLEFQCLKDAELVLVDDLLEGIEVVRREDNVFLVQCSAHPNVHLVTEKYHHQVFVVDTFLHPTRELALLVRVDVEHPVSLGIVPACLGYLDAAQWPEIHYETSKPVVGRKLLEGCYDAGLTYATLAYERPEELRIADYIGPVDTTWLVYGRRRRFAGKVIGTRCPEIFGADSDERSPSNA